MIGQTISHYKILEKLGGGGMGVVYKAQDTHLDRAVALKFLPPDLTLDPDSKERFIHEAKAASALQHNNICVVHDIDETSNGQLFICMELYEGETLKKTIERGPLKVDEAIDIAAQIAQGLEEAHKHQIIHRDVKPANILITASGVVKIVDFGLAKLAGQSRVTKVGSTLGTAAYMSPEQVRAQEVDSRTDIWSLGVVLFEMLTGKLPFRGEHEAALTYSIGNEEPVPIRRLQPDLPSSLEGIVARCLEKDCGKRFQRAEQVMGELRKHQEGTRTPAKVSRKRSTVLWFAVSAVVIIAAILLYVFIPSKQVSTARKSIAVLPFKNLSDNKQDEYFSDGVTEEIITYLSKIGDLKVTSRTSIMRYKNTDKGLREIAHELGVSVILEGSVRRAGDRVRITGQLIDAESDEHIWADTYDREMKDVFAIQTDVAEKIAFAFRSNLSPEEKATLHAKPTESISAHDLFLRGRYQWRQRTSESLQSATTDFERAVQQDPNYALAYVGLADCYALYTYYGIRVLSRAATFERAEKNARRALEINPNLAEAHSSLGNILKEGMWNWERADEEFKKAIALDPGYATAHQWYSECLAVLGRSDESLAEAKRAVELEPFSMVTHDVLGLSLMRMHRYDEAIAQFKQAAEIDPTWVFLHFNLGQAYLLKSLLPEALTEFQRAGAPPQISEIYSAGISDARRLRLLSNQFQISDLWKCFMVSAAVNLGFKDKAFELLSVLVEERNTILPYIISAPILDPIRDDPRYINVLKRMGLD
jgi:serine/threonine protein kinase/Tfp pilus assembly protein PilF